MKSISKFFLLVVFVGIFLAWMNIAKAALKTDGTICDNESACKTECSSGKGYLVVDPYNGGAGDYFMCGVEKVDNVVSVGGSQMDDNVPGVKGPAGIITCGRPGEKMCTLCDLIKGFNTIIQYIMKIAIGGALLALAIGGVMYVVSAGDSGAAETAKSTIKSAAIGFVIIFAAFLIVNTTMQYLGTKKNAKGEPTLGINIVKWGQFDCTANPSR